MRTKYKTTFIYALVDPITNEYKYVGKSDNVNKRYKEHLKYCSSNNTYKDRWLVNILLQNMKPTVIILSEVYDYCWDDAEIWWIKYFRSLGYRLTNGTDGGDGFALTKEIRKRIAESQTGEKSVWFGRKHTERTKLIQSVINTGKSHVNSIHTRCLISIGNTGKKRTAEMNKVQSERNKGKSVVSYEGTHKERRKEREKQFIIDELPLFLKMMKEKKRILS